ncbi:Bro-N domain-containing protein [Lachnospiraceae bacterium 46-61]
MSVLQVIEQREILGKQLTMYGDFEEPLFLAKEVAEWIENKQPTQMVELVDEDEKLKCIINTSGQNREMWFLTEDGLYEVLMQSRKPIAKQFKKEVKTLLKNIRKGMFLPKYIEKANQYSIQDIVKETICQVVPIIIQELEDKAERTKQAEREFEKLEIKVKKKIERLIYSGKHTYSDISKILAADGIELSPAMICFYAESMGIMD